MLYPSTPLSYAIELTYACNNRCSGCANVWESRRSQTMPNWRELFDRIAPPDDRQRYTELIRLTGGEPTLHPDIIRIVQYIDTFGVAHALFTDGRWPKPNEIIDVYRNCQHSLGMLVSLHGSTTEAHLAFVQSDRRAFSETCQNIEKAAKAGIDVFTNTVLTTHSCEQIEEIIALSKNLGAQYTVFNRFLGNDHPLMPTEDRFREVVLLIERLQDDGEHCRVGNCVPRCFVDNTTEGANSGIEHCAISPNGEVRPDNLTGIVFGNIFEQSIVEIWASDKAQWYREQIPAGCLECVELAACRGGAKSVYIEHGLPQDPLMKAPIREAREVVIELQPDMVPVPHFRLRKESFGYIVARYNWSIPVTAAAKPVLNAIDGQRTLFQIQEQFGENGLNLIGHLLKEGCIGFKDLDDDEVLTSAS